MNVFGGKKKSRNYTIIPKSWCHLNQFMWNPQEQSSLLIKKILYCSLPVFLAPELHLDSNPGTSTVSSVTLAKGFDPAEPISCSLKCGK